MPLKVEIPKFTSNDYPILIGSVLPLTFTLNYILFGDRYIASARVLLWATLAMFGILAVVYLFYGIVATFLRNRFPEEHQSFKRLLICLGIFFLMSALFILLIFRGYDAAGFMNYQYSENDFIKGYATLVIANVFVTFLNEGIYRFENYKKTVKETEQLKKEFAHSQLIGLKSQINPHFLFNSLNTLSSLISEDSDSAEEFLDHMSKVYRYMLHNEEDQLVPLETEIRFIHSYYYLLKARYNDALDLSVNTIEASGQIPPLTIQFILENILNNNMFSREKPLLIKIQTDKGYLEITHNIQAKNNKPTGEEEGLNNISAKYLLLCHEDIRIYQNKIQRTIVLPLLNHQEMSVL